MRITQFLSNLSNLESKTTVQVQPEVNDSLFDVDLVIPFVDPSAMGWQETRNMWAVLENLKDTNPNGNNDFRFRDWGLLKYVFRGIYQNLPWIRTVHLIVEDMGHVPGWLDPEKVHIVLHSDLFSPDELPVFSSPAIEMRLNRISGLAEHFIYANDDMFFLKPLEKLDYFTEDGIPLIQFKTKSVFSMDINEHEYRRGFCQKFIFQGDHDRNVLVFDHTPQPLRKSCLDTVLKEHPGLSQIVTRFRDMTRDHSFYVYLIYMVLKGEYVLGSRDTSTLFVSNEKLDLVLEDLEQRQAMCLNDSRVFEAQEAYAQVRSKLDTLFPEMSGYERA